jgi:HK97 family phage prohead protease
VSEQSSRPPRATFIRARSDIEFRSAGTADDLGQGYLGLVKIRFSPVGEWTEVNSSWEGNFMERFAPGAWTKTIRERADKIKALFQHGRDPQIGDKPIGSFHRLEEDEHGGYAEVKLLDTSYNRDLLPGLKEGLYGASHRFGVVRATEDTAPERSEFNPRGIKEVTVTEARLHELGPVTFPQYDGASSGMRSMTDEFLMSCFVSDPDRLREMFDRATDLSHAAAERADHFDAVTVTTAPSPADAAPTGTSAAPERRDDKPSSRYRLARHDPRPSWAL